jgi:glycosyltransferase involved in cell wall biosynthesis
MTHVTTRVTVGIHLRGGAGAARSLAATVESLRSHSPDAGILLLPDGPDRALKSALAAYGDLPQSETARRLGAPACFNRLAAESDSDVLVLLAGGCQVGPRWLDHLLAALAADPRNGLAGPSTNRSWNEQCAFPHAAGGEVGIARSAAEAEARFAGQTRTLEPLLSLADFCYAVRRGVVAAVGAADEGYGRGPCWEMDYNARAARAGFRGVWAKAAYVHRPPTSAEERRERNAFFTASRRRYQDRLCGLRLRAESTGYEPHCRGLACEHFAPGDLIKIHLPTHAAAPAAPSPVPASPRVAPVAAKASPPLISCILPTRNRADFVLQSVRYFERQDYPRRELIVVDDGDVGDIGDIGDIGEKGLAARLPASPRIRYIRLDRRLSIGAKRNLACREARGEILAHWDDDDWYGPRRLSAQAAPLLAGKADVTGLVTECFFDLPAWELWACTPALHRRMFTGDVHGGTLVYRREVLGLASYPDLSLAEDAAFLRRALSRGARLARVAEPGLFAYLRHGANSWSFRCGSFLDPGGWRRTGEPAWTEEDRAFYRRRSAAAQVPQARSKGGSAGIVRRSPLPRVSCIMPTYDRRRFVPRAIEYFLRQDVPDRELIVVDDGTDPVADLMPADPRVRYLRLPRRLTLGAKRNLACGEASGEVVVHWDDDDWSAPHRLRTQVEALLGFSGQGADLCGLSRPLFYDPRQDRAWQYVYPAGGRPWLYGATLAYRRAHWERHPFPELAVGEDNKFVWASAAARIAALPDVGFQVSLIHSCNTSPKKTSGARWHSVPVEKVRALLAVDADFYRDLGREPRE